MKFNIIVVLFCCAAGFSWKYANADDLFPKKEDRICIVGAGPAGIHMAYMLKKMAFTDVEILEKSNEIGGRADSVLRQGVLHEMGTCYTSKDYSTFFSMLSNLSISPKNVPVPHSNFVVPVIGSLRTSVVLIQHIRNLNPSLITLTAIQLKLQEKINAYIYIYNQLFKNNYYEFPLQKPDTWSNFLLKRYINCTIEEFLEKRQLRELEPIFLAGMTSMGYGLLNKISIVYGFMWMTPAYLQEIMKENRDETQLYMYTDGFRSVWQKVAAAAGLKILKNVKITNIKRQKTKPNIEIEINHNIVKKYDWLIFAADILSNKDLIFDADSKDEKDLFNKLNTAAFVTTLTTVSGLDKSQSSRAKILYWKTTLEGKGNRGDRWAERNSAACLNVSESSPNSNTFVVYQYGDFASNETQFLKNVLLRDYKAEFKNSVVTIEEPHYHSYFPHFGVEDIASGILWDILEKVQGKRNTWFIGHSVVFDSVKSVTNYNKMLLEIFYPNEKNKIRVL